jgi:transposase
METNGDAGQRRRYRSRLERRQIVEETFQPGASVARVARGHEVNANQVFYWRKQYREGKLDAVEQSTDKLVPVEISDVTSKLSASRKDPRPATAGTIDIELGHARVRIEGAADPDCVRAALEGLIR